MRLINQTPLDKQLRNTESLDMKKHTTYSLKILSIISDERNTNQSNYDRLYYYHKGIKY